MPSNSTQLANVVASVTLQEEMSAVFWKTDGTEKTEGLNKMRLHQHVVLIDK